MSGWKFDLNPVAVPRVETRYRRIATSLPVPESLEILEALDQFESTAMHGQLPVVWDRAEGFQVHDAWGNMWLDFTSTIFVTNAGHGNPRIVAAVRDQLQKPLLHTYTFPSQIRAEYLRRLIEVTPAQFEKAFLLSAGTEASECVLKLMRMNAWKNGKRRPGIIASEGNWHGRTLGAQMMSFSPSQKDWIGFQDPNIFHLPYPYPWREEAMSDPRRYFQNSIDRLIEEQNLDPDKDFGGFILETFQGWAAAFYPAEYVQELVSFAREHGILVAFDEMQSGFGRTGELFGYFHYGVEPDLLCCGKGASSGLPLALVLGRREIMDLPAIGSMSSTHSANPLVCAAGLANLHALLDDGLIENSRILGELFHERLNAIQARFPSQIRTVLGKGLVAGVIFVNPAGEPLIDLANNIAQESMRRGLLVVHTGRESIKLAPPLSINEEALLEGLSVFEQVTSDCAGIH